MWKVTGATDYNITVDHAAVKKIEEKVIAAGGKITSATIEAIDKLAGGITEFLVGVIEDKKQNRMSTMENLFKENETLTISNINKELKEANKKPWEAMSPTEQEEYLDVKNKNYVALSNEYDNLFKAFQNGGSVQEQASRIERLKAIIPEMQEMHNTMLLSDADKNTIRQNSEAQFNAIMSDPNIQQYILIYNNPKSSLEEKQKIAQIVSDYMQSAVDINKKAHLTIGTLREGLAGTYTYKNNSIIIKSSSDFDKMFSIVAHETDHANSLNTNPKTISESAIKENNTPKTTIISSKNQPYIEYDKNSKDNNSGYYQNPAEKSAMYREAIAYDLIKKNRGNKKWKLQKK